MREPPPSPNPTISPPSLRVFACQMGNALLRVVHGSWTRVMIQCINTSLVIWCDWCADVWWSWCSIWGQFNILASFTSWYDNLEQTRRKFLPPFPQITVGKNGAFWPPWLPYVQAEVIKRTWSQSRVTSQGERNTHVSKMALARASRAIYDF